MASKATIIVAIGLGIGAVILATKQAKAALPEESPTVADIVGAQNLAELDGYYELLSSLWIIKKIDVDTYRTLYNAYKTRFYELVGG